MKSLILLFKLVVVPLGLGYLAIEIAKDPRVGLVQVDAWLLAAALLANQVALALFAARMRLALGAFGMVISMVQALRVHLQSIFYFFVLPMTVGQEMARFAKIRTIVGDQVGVAALTWSLLADRLVGAAAAFMLALALLPFVEFHGLVTWAGAAPWLPFAGLAIVAVLLLLAHGKVRRHAGEMLALVRSGRRGLWRALAMAVVTHCCFAFAIHLAAIGANVQIQFVQTLFAISAAMLFVILPVSFAGVSPVEAAGLGVVVGMGIPVEQAAIFVLLSYLAKLVGAFEGGAWEFWEGSRGLGRSTRNE